MAQKGGSLLFVDTTTGDVSFAVASNTWSDYEPILTHYVSPHGETDPLSEKLYIAVNDAPTLRSWEDFYNENVLRNDVRNPDDYYPALWTSKPYIVPPTIDYVAAQVVASDYPVSVTVSELHPANFAVAKSTTYAVKSSEPFRLKSVRPGFCLSFSFTSLTDTIFRVQFVSATGEFR